MIITIVDIIRIPSSSIDNLKKVLVIALIAAIRMEQKTRCAYIAFLFGNSKSLWFSTYHLDLLWILILMLF